MIKRNRGYGISRARYRDPLTVCVCMCGGEEGGDDGIDNCGFLVLHPKVRKLVLPPG